LDGVTRAEGPSYDELERAWRSLRTSRGVRVREVACVGAARTLMLAEIGDHRAPAVTITAGTHGDEPCGPWSLYAIVRDGLLDDRLGYRLWPCVNPSGARARTRENAEGDDINRSFSRGGTTPEARAIITANRDRRFALAIDLHEDCEADGYYVYEPLGDALALGSRIVAALDDAGLPVQRLDDGFDLATPAGAEYTRRLERGRVVLDFDEERKWFTGLPYSLAVTRRAARRALTCESPRGTAWQHRLAAHRIAVTTALATLAAAGREEESSP